MMHWAVWCMFRAYHLCVGNIISVVDTWDWTMAYNETTSTDIVSLQGPRRSYHLPVVAAYAVAMLHSATVAIAKCKSEASGSHLNCNRQA